MVTQAAQLTLEQVKFSTIEHAYKAQLLMSRLCGKIAAFRSDEWENAFVCDRMQRFIMEEIHVCSVSMTPAPSGYEILLNTK